MSEKFEFQLFKFRSWSTLASSPSAVVLFSLGLTHVRISSVFLTFPAKFTSCFLSLIISNFQDFVRLLAPRMVPVSQSFAKNLSQILRPF